MAQNLFLEIFLNIFLIKFKESNVWILRNKKIQYQ